MGKEERVIKDRLQKLAKKMKELGYHEHWARLTVEYVDQLQEKGMLAVDRLVQRLERCTKGSDKREYWDVLIEGRFAVTLADNNFSGIEVEYCSKGPDIKAEWDGNTIYFEVKRKRSKVDEWEVSPEDVKLPSGKPEDIISRIHSKLKQLKPGEINIIVLCSSTIAVDKHGVREAFKLIEQDPKEYEKLSGILFTNDWGIDIATMKQFDLFKNENTSKPIGPRLADKLEYMRDQSAEELQRNWQEVATLIKAKGKR